MQHDHETVSCLQPNGKEPLFMPGKGTPGEDPGHVEAQFEPFVGGDDENAYFDELEAE